MFKDYLINSFLDCDGAQDCAALKYDEQPENTILNYDLGRLKYVTLEYSFWHEIILSWES